MRVRTRATRLVDMLPSPRSLLGVIAAAIALLAGAVPGAQAAWPGTPGKVAYLDQSSNEYPLKVYTPGLDGAGTTETIVPKTFHFTDVAHGDTTPLTAGFPSAPVWSPDGTRLAFAAAVPDASLAPGATHLAIFTWRLRDGAITQVTTPPAGKPGCESCDQEVGYVYADYAPAWSPDGQKLAFVRLQQSGKDEPIHGTDGADVRIVAATGGDSTALTHSHGAQAYTALAWGGDPQGTSTLAGLMADSDAGTMSVRRIDPAGGAESTALSGVEAAEIIDFDVAPNGMDFYYEQAGGAVFRRPFGSGESFPAGKVSGGALMRASPTGNGPLYNGQASVPGVASPRGGLVEYQEDDPGGDVWPEDPKQRWIDGFLAFKAGAGFALTTIGRSLFDVQAQQLPIIDIPGFGGSEIRCGSDTLWGPTILGMGSKLKAMELQADGKTNAGCANAGPTENPDDPTGFVMSVLGGDIYAPQAKFITDIAPGGRGWRFSWDWRKAPAESLDRLDQLVDKALGHDFAKDQGVTRVVMYGHSYGGLLMREYQDLHPEKLARVLTAGTPFWGSAKPLNFATFGLENPLSGIADLDTLMPNAAASRSRRTWPGCTGWCRATTSGRG